MATPASRTPSETENDDSKPRTSSGLWQRLAKKLKPPAAASVSSSPSQTLGPGVPGDFVSKENREAALRARGLLRRDLSELEKEQERYTKVVAPPTQDGDESAARKIQQEWLAKHAEPSPATSDRRRPHKEQP